MIHIFSCTWIKVAKISLGIFGPFTSLKIIFFSVGGVGSVVVIEQKS